MVFWECRRCKLQFQEQIIQSNVVKHCLQHYATICTFCGSGALFLSMDTTSRAFLWV
jgi:hypothetical protein